MRTFSSRRLALTLTLSLSVVACKKEPKPQGGATAPAGGPPPAGVLATATVPSGKALLDAARTYADAVQPGVSGMITEQGLSAGLGQVLHADSLDGVDFAGPMYALAVDTDASRGVALIVHVTDHDAFARHKGQAGLAFNDKGDWAAIGEPSVVTLVGAWAFANLVGAPLPRPLVVVSVDVPRIAARYQPQIDAKIAQLQGLASSMPNAAAMAPIVNGYAAAARALLTQSDRVGVALTIADGRASLDYAVAPKAGTTLATFVAAQQPSDYAMLGKLPAGSDALLAAGQLTFGPYHDAWMQAANTLLGTAEGGADLTAAMKAFADAADGRFAMTFGLTPGGGAHFTELLGLSDEAVARTTLGTMLTALAGGRDIQMMGTKVKMTGTVAAGEHDGVAISSYLQQVDLTTGDPAARAGMEVMLPGGQRETRLAVFDKLLLVNMGSGPDAMNVAIDAARGKAPAATPAPDIAALVAESRGLKESVIMTMDFGAWMSAVNPDLAGTFPPGTVLGFAVGFADEAMHLRMVLPSSAAHAMAAARMGH